MASLGSSRDKSDERPISMPTPSAGASDSGKAMDGASRTRLAQVLGSAKGLEWAVAAVVLITGTLIAALGQTSLRQSHEELTHTRFQEQTRAMAETVSSSLKPALAISARLEQVAHASPLDTRVSATGSVPLRELAYELASAVRAHAGIVYSSVSYPNGDFIGAFIDDDGTLRFQISRVLTSGEPVDAALPAGQRLIYDFVPPRALNLRSQTKTVYDPRVRPFYLQAKNDQKAGWTKPYLFYENKATGLTRVTPVLLAGALASVITVDFDVSALSRVVTELQPVPGVRTLLHTSDGVMLAVPKSLLPRDLSKSEHPLSFSDLPDATINHYFSLPEATREGWQTTNLAGTDRSYYALRSPVELGEETRWTVSALVPASVHESAYGKHQTRSAIIVFAALLVSVGLATWLGRYLRRAQAMVKTAEDSAKQAEVRAARALGALRELGSYELVHCLGKGGMGEVWRARHRLLPRDAAVKLIRADEVTHGSLAELQERFRREAKTLATLRSRHTVGINDYGIAADGSLFLVMELMEGLDLHRMVKLTGPMPPARVIHVLEGVCRSLAEAHALGIVHRDLKPANLFLCAQSDEVDIPKVLDFGLVHLSQEEDPLDPEAGGAPLVERASQLALRSPKNSELTQRGVSMGTPTYMAPEQVMGMRPTPASDVYALGGIAVFMLTKRPVFDKPDSTATMMAQVIAPVPQFEEWAPGIPDALSLFIRKCLEKEPTDRPASAVELLAMVRELRHAHPWTEASQRGVWDEKVWPHLKAESAKAIEPASKFKPRFLEIGGPPGGPNDANKTGNPTKGVPVDAHVTGRASA
jgi:serine/threonine protein kinase